MNNQSVLAGMNLRAIQQVVKWIVYSILLVNFVFYVLDDMEAAEHSLHSGDALLRWTAAFTTTIDELAWFALLALFELETYMLSDEAFEGMTGKLIHGVRLMCFAFLAHTIYAYFGDVVSLSAEEPLQGVTNLCQLAGQDVSYVFNLVYTVIDQANCASLSAGSIFYNVDSTILFTDEVGILYSLGLAWADLFEAIIWLAIVLLIEFVVRLQGRGISSGPLITFCNYTKPILYGLLLIIAGYWATLGHWLYVWDEIIWIAGFVAIEANVVEWRGEIDDEAMQVTEQAGSS
jgi:hypothetical protein